MAKTKSPVAPQGKADTKTKGKGLSGKVKTLAGAALAVTLVSVSGGWYLLSEAEAKNAPVSGLSIPGPMPSPSVVARVAAEDYQIVSIFGDEAIVATRSNLVRLKVGSTAPGLGTVTAIEAGSGGGGTVIATDATLRSL